MPVAAYAKRVGQVVAMIVLLGPPAMAGDAAHTIADKFSGPEQTQPTADERRKAEEERKREAARKAQEALREEARLRAEAALKADREKLLALMKKAGAPAAKSDQQPATDEDEMLARARLEAQQREQAETAVARAKRIEETERARRQMDDLLARQLQPAQESTDEARVAMIAAARTAYRSALRRGEIARAEADAEAARRQAVATAVRIYRDGSVRRETAARVLAEAEAMHQRVAAAVRVHREATARAASSAWS